MIEPVMNVLMVHDAFLYLHSLTFDIFDLFGTTFNTLNGNNIKVSVLQVLLAIRIMTLF